MLTEGLRYKELTKLIKPTIHIDEFSSKMGDDDDIIVMSFFVRAEQAAEDLVNWFEKGYEFVVDADRSPGELKPGRYLVYAEIKRRSSFSEQLAEILEDLSTLCEFTPGDWIITYNGEDYPYSSDLVERIIPLSPLEYRKKKEGVINEFRSMAGLDHKSVYEGKDAFIRLIQQQAGL